MRVTGGRFRSRTLEGPPRGARGTRPTTDRVREALFSALGARMDLSGARVLDLFAGTGALGLEAISRGAAHAAFVEAHNPTLGIARRNARALGVADLCSFVRGDALAHLARPLAPPPDIVFADPPYALERLPEIAPLALDAVASGGMVVLEHDDRHDFSEHPACVFSRDYGATRLSLFEG
ncbi:MAG: RsmD family RNA methyltransferase [Bacteroidota bacterium]